MKLIGFIQSKNLCNSVFFDMEQKTEQSLEEDVGFLLTHPFQHVQAGVRSLVAPPIPNTRMELHRDSNQPM